MIQEKKKKRPTAAAAAKGTRRKPARTKAERPQPEVTYVPPVPVNRRKLVIRLVTALAAALAIFLGCTVFFRVKDVVVTGNERYAAWTVREASGIEQGSGLLTFGKTKTAAKVMQQLRYVKSVRIGITLPDTVNIHIEELEVLYGVQDTEDGWWMLSADGRVVEQANETKARQTTVLKGFRILEPKIGEQAEVSVPVEDAADVPVLVTDRERLEAALTVAAHLERCEILGEAASVDSTDPGRLCLWYGDDYQVMLGDPDRMDEKIMMMRSVIEQHKQSGGYQSGVLDITLTTDSDSVIYTPFG